ncbi:MAG: hypothetical protein V4692_04560, partial [Bdellovibrionota bacterium]
MSKPVLSRLLVASLVSLFAVASPGVAHAAPKKPTKKTTASAKAKAASKTTAKSSNRTALEMQREKSALPSSRALKTVEAPRSLGQVKPPRSNDFFEATSKEAEYENLVDQEIKALYRLSQQNKRSPNRGEIWLRLGERYVEKARLVEFREQAGYETKLKEFMDKKT